MFSRSVSDVLWKTQTVLRLLGFIVLDVFEALERDYGRIDIVCNNAGIHSFDYDVDRSQRAFRINLVRSRHRYGSRATLSLVLHVIIWWTVFSFIHVWFHVWHYDEGIIWPNEISPYISHSVYKRLNCWLLNHIGRSIKYLYFTCIVTCITHHDVLLSILRAKLSAQVLLASVLLYK